MLVTLRQFQYIIAVADTGSFSKAAELVHAEQSTVSQQVRTLEERLGVEIFNRKNQPITPTEKGKEVIDKARYIVDKVEELLIPFKLPVKKFS